MFVTSITLPTLPDLTRDKLIRSMEELVTKLRDQPEPGLVHAYLMHNAQKRAVLVAVWSSRDALNAVMRSPAGAGAARMQGEIMGIYGAELEEFETTWTSMPSDAA